MIEVRNVTKKYGNHTAVSDLSFTVEDGLITGFLGPNGAGKSTTMNIMTGYLAPSSGTVLINDVDILEDPEGAKKQIGYLPELPPLYTDMTVDEYLTFVSELKKVPKNERQSQIETIKEMVSLKDVEKRLIKNLSKGYKQRVGFAQALIGFPPIIILDEPMVGLDPKQIIEIRDLIKKLKENHTVILSSHILSEISMVCDKIVIISNGNLVAYDTPEHLTESSKGKTEIRLTAKCDENTLRSIVEAFEGTSIEIKEKEDGLYSDAVITSDADNELIEKIFFAFANASVPLVELHHIESSLEDVFLELTDKNDEVTEEGEEE